MEEVTLTANDGLRLSVALYEVDEPKALVQIIHGAKEHKGRYDHFCTYLQKEGFAVIVSDNRGHGKSTNEDYPFGFMDGPEQIVDDQLRVTKYIKEYYPGKELYLFGHSLGSLFARMYLQNHDDEIQKLVLSGTANYVPGVNVGIKIGNMITRFSGKQGYSKLLSLLSGIETDDMSWISINEENWDAIRNDPLYVKRYPNVSHMTIFKADSELHQFDKYNCANPDLKILSVTGEGDPITGSSKGLRDSLYSLKKMGYQHITNRLYTGMNHEIINEKNNRMVYKDIVRFLSDN